MHPMLITPCGWNTWDVRHLNAVVQLDAQIALHLSLYDPANQSWRTLFGWRDGVGRLGPHASDGSYCQIELRWGQVILAVEYAAEGQRLVCQVRPATTDGLLLAVALRPAWAYNAAPLALPHTDATGQTWHLRSSRQADLIGEDGSTQLFNATAPLLLELAPDAVSGADGPHDLLARRQAAYAAVRLQSAGWLADAADGLTRVVAWNTIWEPLKGRICTPVSRDWCRDDGGFGDYVLFCWDTFFCALLAALEDPALAAANLRAILQEITPSGFVPNFGSARGASLDRSQPPVGAYCVLKLYRAGVVDATFLAEVYPALLRWHAWWLPHRDGNGDGLLEWGSDPPTAGVRDWQSHNRQAAMYESGLDNSPLWDDVAFNPAANTLELTDVGLNALYALDAWALAAIATALGRMDAAAYLTDEHRVIGERMNTELWDEQRGIYCNRHWNGSFSTRRSPTLLYPLLAGIVPPERAERLVREHLLDAAALWGPLPPPSIARDDPAFAEQIYWRGRIWPPLVFLLCEGLRRYHYYGVAHDLARRSLDLFLGEWRAEGHIHENYNGISGDGDDSRWSDPLYTWGALLAYVGIQELADAEAWGGLRFGCLTNEPAALKGHWSAAGTLDVENGPDGLRVHQGAALLLATNRPALITGYRRTPGDLCMRLECATRDAPVTLRLGQLPPGRTLELSGAGQRQTVEPDATGQLTITVRTPADLRIVWATDTQEV